MDRSIDEKSVNKTHKVNSVFIYQKQLNGSGINKFEDQKLYTKDGINSFSCVIPLRVWNFRKIKYH